MDCKSFSTRHAAYIDDTLPGVEMSAMRDHLTACAKCARRDADVRRALMLLKNLPPITVSGSFQDRLRARLEAENESPVVIPEARVSQAGAIKWAVAAGLIIVVAGGITSLPKDDDVVTRLPAVTATAAEMPMVDESAPAYVASMSTGIPMWPALMLAEEGPLRFANGVSYNNDTAVRP